MSGWRVTCTWWEILDGRTLSYAHQSEYETQREGWGAFYQEQTIQHPGKSLIIDLYDIGGHRVLESWSAHQGIKRSDAPIVSLAKIQELNQALRKKGRRLEDRRTLRDEEDE